MTIDTGDEGRSRLYAYCRALKKLLVNGENPIDHIIAGGNSGISLSEIALLVCDILKVPRPRVLRVPFYRYQPGHRDDIEYRYPSDFYQKQVDQYISQCGCIGTLLFVDDEISMGTTALGLLQLIENSASTYKIAKPQKYYILAEDQGFEVPLEMKAYVQFLPFAYEIDGYNNLIFCFMPSEFEKPLVMCFGGDNELSFHLRANILLNLPTKKFNNGQPIYTDELLVKARKSIPDFDDLQKNFRKFLTGEIVKALG